MLGTLFSGLIIIFAVLFIHARQVMAPKIYMHNARVFGRTMKFSRFAQQSVGTITKISAGNPQITYKITDIHAHWYFLPDLEIDNSLGMKDEEYMPAERDNVSKSDLKDIFQVIRVIHGTKGSVAEVRQYEKKYTRRTLTTSPYALNGSDGFVTASALQAVPNPHVTKKLARTRYYLNEHGGGFYPDKLGLTSVRVWNYPPGTVPMATSRDCSPYMYEQLFATAEVTNYQGRKYIHLEDKWGPIGWIRQNYQLTKGRYVDPAERLLHVKDDESLQLRKETETEQAGASYQQRVYTVYRGKQLKRCLIMSFSHYANVFTFHGKKIVTAEFYDHNWRLIKRKHDSQGLHHEIYVDPQKGLPEDSNDAGRVIDFHHAKKQSQIVVDVDDGSDSDDSSKGSSGNVWVKLSGESGMKNDGGYEEAYG